MSHGDHGSGDTSSDMMMMSMFFHFGKDETVLFEFWKTKNTVAFVFSLLVIFLLAFSYEALKYWRDQLFSLHLERSRSSLGVSVSRRTIWADDGTDGFFSESRPMRKQLNLLNYFLKSKILNGFHMVQTVLHMVQFVLSYFLMLIFMTYNVWLAMAVTLGAGAGYFCFGWNKLTSHDITEHCQ